MTELQTAAFFAEGTPRPQGSKTPTAGGGMRESSKYLKAWRETVADAAASTGVKLTGPVRVVAEFIMPRTKAMKPDADLTHTAAPDVDKLVRAVGDALTNARVVTDDRVIVAWTASKRRAAVDETPGVAVTVTPVGETSVPVCASAGTASATTDPDDASSLIDAAASGDQLQAMIALRDLLAAQLEESMDARATASLAARFTETLERIDDLGGIADAAGETPLAAALAATGGDR